MIKNESVAKQISDVMIKCSEQLDLSVALVQEKCGEEELRVYRRAVGKALGDIYLEIMIPLYQAHPELTPPGLDIPKV
ncbi:hypothetical protein GCM10007862_25640 [Dyella lipolytica]|nr:hypothetical protein GCM10007862_25640 [Dyella lipolytica]